MMDSKWYIFNSGYLSGDVNMAFDSLLSGGYVDRPCLRLYQWDPYALSLGYNQSSEVIDAEKLRKAGLDFVRRPTGGRAVLHAEELTYSVVVPSESSLFNENVHVLYENINLSLQKGFKNFGIPTELERRKRRLQGSKVNPACFSSAARSEIKYKGRKIIGSAQRRYKTAVLQHGSILTGPYHLKIVDFLKNVPENLNLSRQAVSLSEITGSPVDITRLKDSIIEGFECVMKITFENRDPEELLSESYKIRKNFNCYIES